MSRKKLVVLLVIIIFMILEGGKTKAYSIENFSEILKREKANFTSLEINTNVDTKIKDKLSVIVKKIFIASGLKGKCCLFITNNKAILKFDSKQAHGEINAHREGSEICYISFCLSQNFDEKNINNNIRGSILKGYSIYNINPSFSTLIKGQLDCDFSDKKVLDIMKLLKCENIKITKVLNTISATGYSNVFKETVNYGKEKFNINLGIHYNKKTKKLDLLLGNPLILVEY